MTTWGAGAAEWQMRWHELVRAVVRVHAILCSLHVH